MGEYYVNGELFHYGIKGQKWGKRRYQNSDGSLTAAGKKRYGDASAFKEVDRQYRSEKKAINKTYNKEYNKAYWKYETSLPFTKRRSEALDDMYNAGEKYRDSRDAAKEKYKTARAAVAKSAVKKYEKKYNEAVDAEDRASEKWGEANDQYKSLGKTKITRAVRAAMSNSDAAKKYRQMYDDWEKSAELAETKWTEAKAEHKNTGRNFVDRVINNVKYGS